MSRRLAILATAHRCLWLFVLATLVIGTPIQRARAELTLYGAAHQSGTSGESTLYTINPGTGEATGIGDGIGVNAVSAMDFAADGTLYATGITPTGHEVGGGKLVLLTIDTFTGQGTVVRVLSHLEPGELQQHERITDMSFHWSDGTLYGYNKYSGSGPGSHDQRLVTLSVDFGMTPIGDTGLYNSGNGIAMSLDSELYHAGLGFFGLSTLNLDTGEALGAGLLSGIGLFDRINAMDVNDDPGDPLYGEMIVSIRLEAGGRVLGILDPLTGEVTQIDDTVAGLDALAWEPIPAPGAALLGMIGLGLVGWVRRRFC